MSSFRLFFAAIAAAFGFCTMAMAEDAPPLHVATRVVAPLVEKKDGQLTGFSIELWNAIAAKLGKRSEFQEFPNVASLLDAIHTHKADLGIAAISITAERDKEFDFSQPIMNAGLQTLIPGKSQNGTSTPLEGLLRLLFSPIILVWLGIALLLIIIPAHLVWLLERHRPDGIIPEPNYIPGIFHALWWAAGTLATQADQMPKQWLARIVAALWMFTSVVFVAYYTAQLTASLTVEQIQGDIKGPDDLPGKKVATTKGSTASEVVKSRGGVVKEFDTIDDAYAALSAKSVDAVVYDAPVLLFYSEHAGKGLVQPVGPIFHKEDYGIVFDENNELRKQADLALLALREDGTYDQIYQKWFGGS